MSEEPFDIRVCIIEKIRELYGPDIEESLATKIISQELIIDPYKLHDRDALASCRLHDQTYIQIFYELLKNATIHGHSIDGKVPIQFEREEIRRQGDPKPALVISNGWEREPTPKLVGAQLEDQWMPISFASPSGLSFAAMVLNKTSSGVLLARVLRDPNIFQIGLMLDGMR